MWISLMSREVTYTVQKKQPLCIEQNTNNNEGCMLIGHGVIVLKHILVSIVLAAY